MKQQNDIDKLFQSRLGNKEMNVPQPPSIIVDANTNKKNKVSGINNILTRTNIIIFTIVLALFAVTILFWLKHDNEVQQQSNNQDAIVDTTKASIVSEPAIQVNNSDSSITHKLLIPEETKTISQVESTDKTDTTIQNKQSDNSKVESVPTKLSNNIDTVTNSLPINKPNDVEIKDSAITVINKPQANIKSADSIVNSPPKAPVESKSEKEDKKKKRDKKEVKRLR